MRTHTLYPVITILAGLTMACAPAPVAEVDEGPSEAEMIAAADALDQRFLAAMNAGDAEAIASMYAADAVSLPPDMMIARGPADISTGLGAMFQQMPGVQMEVTESHQIPAGDTDIGWGIVNVVVPGENGATEEMEMRYTDVKTERDGQWVYILDHASAPMPAAE